MGKVNGSSNRGDCPPEGGNTSGVFFYPPVGDWWENPRNEKGVTYPLQIPYTKRRKSSPR